MLVLMADRPTGATFSQVRTNAAPSPLYHSWVSRTAAEPGIYIPPSRRTKKTFTAWMDKAALEQLKELAHHQKVPQQKLIAEAFNMLFEKHGLPPIAT